MCCVFDAQQQPFERVAEKENTAAPRSTAANNTAGEKVRAFVCFCARASVWLFCFATTTNLQPQVSNQNSEDAVSLDALDCAAVRLVDCAAVSTAPLASLPRMPPATTNVVDKGVCTKKSALAQKKRDGLHGGKGKASAGVDPSQPRAAAGKSARGARGARGGRGARGARGGRAGKRIRTSSDEEEDSSDEELSLPSSSESSSLADDMDDALFEDLPPKKRGKRGTKPPPPPQFPRSAYEERRLATMAENQAKLQQIEAELCKEQDSSDEEPLGDAAAQEEPLDDAAAQPNGAAAQPNGAAAQPNSAAAQQPNGAGGMHNTCRKGGEQLSSCPGGAWAPTPLLGLLARCAARPHMGRGSAQHSGGSSIVHGYTFK